MIKYRVQISQKSEPQRIWKDGFASIDEALESIHGEIVDKGAVVHIVPYEEPEPKDVPELIPDHAAAVEYLGIAADCGPSFVYNDDAVAAFDDLLTLCKAWNKADGFEPDRTNDRQRKYYPYTVCVANDLICNYNSCAYTYGYPIETAFTFKDAVRANQFGNKFIDLFKQLYGIKK